jgi:hypothetical protein
MLLLLRKYLADQKWIGIAPSVQTLHPVQNKQEIRHAHHQCRNNKRASKKTSGAANGEEWL